MLVAAGQFAVTSVWEKNAEICASLMVQAAENEVSLFVLPEALLARDDHDADLSVKSAQLLEGEFLGRLRRESKRNMMTTILTIHVPSTPGRAWNMLVALQAGNIVARYAKLHLYDAFAIQESRHVDAGDEIAPLLEVEGMKVGLMTCYDLRFPELALAQALQGAEILVLPAAWVRGPLKEHHWSTLLAARALDTTCYMVAAGECGNKNIGQSRIIDPFGVTIAAASEMPALIMAEVTPERVRQVFLGRLRRDSKRNMMTTNLTIHVPSSPGRAWNMLVALQAGNIVARYAKLHLSDAFAIQESRHVDAGNEIAPLLEVEGMKVGLMSCAVLRFPELALAQALQGADILVLPAAWDRGPLNEHHWSTLLAARALDTTCYMVAAGECGNIKIGQSRIIDPFGVTIAAASEMPALIMAEVTPERVRQVRAQLPVLNNRRFAPPQLL